MIGESVAVLELRSRSGYKVCTNLKRYTHIVIACFVLGFLMFSPPF
jgi:hypothetical protein